MSALALDFAKCANFSPDSGFSEDDGVIALLLKDDLEEQVFPDSPASLVDKIVPKKRKRSISTHRWEILLDLQHFQSIVPDRDFKIIYRSRPKCFSVVNRVSQVGLPTVYILVYENDSSYWVLDSSKWPHIFRENGPFSTFFKLIRNLKCFFKKMVGFEPFYEYGSKDEMETESLLTTETHL